MTEIENGWNVKKKEPLEGQKPQELSSWEVFVGGWQLQTCTLFHRYYLSSELSLPRLFSLQICNSLNSLSLPFYQYYSLLFLIYCTCLVVQEPLNYQTTTSPTFTNFIQIGYTAFCRNFIFAATNRLCSLAVSLLFATILLLLSNSLLKAWLFLFFLPTVLLLFVINSLCHSV